MSDRIVAPFAAASSDAVATFSGVQCVDGGLPLRPAGPSLSQLLAPTDREGLVPLGRSGFTHGAMGGLCC